MKSRRRVAHRGWIVLPLAVALCASGCVERRLLIRSNPPGALVKIDDEEIGTTPVSTSFVYYGDRKIQLVKDGYETLTVMQPIPPPWYELPGVDFFSEQVVPSKNRDIRLLDYNLQPAAQVPNDQLLQRAQQLRQNAQAAAAAAPQSAVPQPVAPVAPGAPGSSPFGAPGALPAAQPLPPPQMFPPAMQPPPQSMPPAQPLPGTPMQ